MGALMSTPNSIASLERQNVIHGAHKGRDRKEHLRSVMARHGVAPPSLTRRDEELYHALEVFAESSYQDMFFPSGLTEEQRKTVHRLACLFNLGHQTYVCRTDGQGMLLSLLSGTEADCADIDTTSSSSSSPSVVPQVKQTASTPPPLPSRKNSSSIGRCVKVWKPAGWPNRIPPRLVWRKKAKTSQASDVSAPAVRPAGNDVPSATPPATKPSSSSSVAADAGGVSDEKTAAGSDLTEVTDAPSQPAFTVSVTSPSNKKDVSDAATGAGAASAGDPLAGDHQTDHGPEVQWGYIQDDALLSSASLTTAGSEPPPPPVDDWDETSMQFYRRLWAFIQSDEQDLHFGNNLTRRQRRKLHAVAEAMSLDHHSRGKRGVDRHIVVSKVSEEELARRHAQTAVLTRALQEHQEAMQQESTSDSNESSAGDDVKAGGVVHQVMAASPQAGQLRMSGHHHRPKLSRHELKQLRKQQRQQRRARRHSGNGPGHAGQQGNGGSQQTANTQQHNRHSKSQQGNRRGSRGGKPKKRKFKSGGKQQAARSQGALINTALASYERLNALTEEVELLSAPSSPSTASSPDSPGPSLFSPEFPTPLPSEAPDSVATSGATTNASLQLPPFVVAPNAPVLRVMSWNIEWFDNLFVSDTEFVKAKQSYGITDGHEICVRIASTIRDLRPDLLAIVEGPSSLAKMELFNSVYLGNEFDVFFAGSPPAPPFPIQRSVSARSPAAQHAHQRHEAKAQTKPRRKSSADKSSSIQLMFFLVRKDGPLTDVGIFEEADRFLSRPWQFDVNGDCQLEDYEFTRRPLMVRGRLRLTSAVGHTRIVPFFAACMHCKSKFIHQGKKQWNSAPAERDKFIRKAVRNRRRIASELLRLRACLDEFVYHDYKNPLVVVCGDANDGPGMDFFEHTYLLSDSISGLLGSPFRRNQMLRSMLISSRFVPTVEEQWTVEFDDFIDGTKKSSLLDQILVSRSLWKRATGAAIEHDVYDRYTSDPDKRQGRPSDHRPVTAQFSLLDM